MAGGEVAKRQPRAEGDAGTRVGAGHQRIHVISHRVQPRDGFSFHVDDLCIGGGDQAPRRPQIAGIEFDGIERRAEQGGITGVRLMARIAHRPVIAVAAFSKFPIHALRGVAVVAGYRLAQGLGIQTKLLRQRGQGIGFVQIAGGDQGVIIDRRRACQPEAVTLHRLGVAE